MILFLNDKKIRLINSYKPIDTSKFDLVLNKINYLDEDYLKGKILVVGADESLIMQFIEYLEKKPLKNLFQIAFVVKNKEQTFDQISKKFKLIRAAGGIIEKGDNVLLMRRLGKWDFPKGKMEQGETKIEAAIREVEEECNIKVELLHKITKTYHSYLVGNKRNLKVTYWYRMKCKDDSTMAPQVEEDIEELIWIDKSKVTGLLKTNSYNSIRHLYKKYYKI